MYMSTVYHHHNKNEHIKTPLVCTFEIRDKSKYTSYYAITQINDMETESSDDDEFIVKISPSPFNHVTSNTRSPHNWFFELGNFIQNTIENTMESQRIWMGLMTKYDLVPWIPRSALPQIFLQPKVNSQYNEKNDT